MGGNKCTYSYPTSLLWDIRNYPINMGYPLFDVTLYQLMMFNDVWFLFHVSLIAEICQNFVLSFFLSFCRSDRSIHQFGDDLANKYLKNLT